MEPINPYAAAPLRTEGVLPQHPTSVRWGVLALSIAMAVLLYLDRFALNVMQPVVIKELGLSATQMGIITSAFFWTYALAQVPAGTLGDRWGARFTLTLFVAVWSLAFAAQAMAFSFAVLVIFRALQGIAQAGAYSVTAGFLKHWIEPTRRGFANSAVSMGGRAGGVLTNILTPIFVAALVPLMLRWQLFGESETGGAWRVVFLAYAALGLVWAVIFGYWFRNRPQQHAGVSPAELATIQDAAESNKPPVVGASAPVPAPPWWIVLTNRNLWLLSSIMFCVNIGWIFLATSQTTYLSDVFELSLVAAGSYTGFTAFAGMAGCICGGLATDWLMKNAGEVWGRRLPGLVACGGAAAMYAVSFTMTTPLTVAITFAAVYFLNDFLLGSLWSTVQDVGQKNSGAMFGFINMSGNLGAAIFPYVIGVLVDQKRWDAVFIASASAFALAFVLWFFVDPRIKLPTHAEA